MRIVPAIDLRAGKCVRLFQGDFAQERQYSDDPLAVARRFSSLAVRDLHVVDLDGALTGRQGNTPVIRSIAESTDLDIQVGGGIRTAETIEHWLANRVARCVIGSAAVKEPELARGWLQRFGGDHIVLALDVVIGEDQTPRPATDGWTETSELTLWDCLDRYLDAGLQHVLCTDISRDGALAGPNLELYEEILRRYPGIDLQASGGVRDAADLAALRERHLPAAITGRALLDGRISADEVAAFQHDE